MTLIDNNDINDKNINDKISEKKYKGFRFYGRASKAGLAVDGKTKKNQDIPLIHCTIGNIKGFNMF